MTSFVDFFFRRSPVDTTQLEFVDNDARLDFFDFLCDEGLIPNFEMLSTGDWRLNPKKKKKPKKKKSQYVIFE